MTVERELVNQIVNNIEKVIIGKRVEVFNIMKGILANGHILIEDVPGVGKTTLIKALAKSLSLSFSRVQFTPDLLPTDITGVSIFNQKNREFEFKKGPIFSNIILADEINRTSPKTQSALLEAMEEKQISDGVKTYKLQEPFLVLATQNPIEYEGTFPLPEAQLDRFMIKVKVGYPEPEDEMRILERYKENNPIEEIESVAAIEEVLNLQQKVREVKVNNAVNEYIVNLVNQTRNYTYLILGGSIRASLALMRIAQASALIEGRDYVTPEDIKSNAVSVLAHRITTSSSAKANNYTSEKIVRDIINNTHVPRVK